VQRNADARVHMHVVPRYCAERSWGGLVFSDPHFGSLFGTEQRVLEQRALALLAAAIRTHLPEDAAAPAATS
jgi:diadenosine tetraphosphate (Ap4A) HIT family hydrolase